MSEPAFLAALAEFQAELPRIDKAQTAKVDSQKGRSYSYTYADLALVTDALAPLLAKHGLSFTSRPTLASSGFVLAYSLSHKDGHRDAGEFPLPDPAAHSPQQIGSAITYARRYCLLAVTGAAPSDEDDDGQKAADSRAAQSHEPAADEASLLRSGIAGLGRGMGWTDEQTAERFAEWSRGQFITDADVATLADFRAWLDEERKRGNREHRQLVAATTDSTQAGKPRKDAKRADVLDKVPPEPDFEGAA